MSLFFVDSVFFSVILNCVVGNVVDDKYRVWVYVISIENITRFVDEVIERVVANLEGTDSDSSDTAAENDHISDISTVSDGDTTYSVDESTDNVNVKKKDLRYIF